MCEVRYLTCDCLLSVCGWCVDSGSGCRLIVKHRHTSCDSPLRDWALITGRGLQNGREGDANFTPPLFSGGGGVAMVEGGGKKF